MSIFILKESGEDTEDIVQDFHVKKQTPYSVVLEWLAPRKDDLLYYKV